MKWAQRAHRNIESVSVCRREIADVGMPPNVFRDIINLEPGNRTPADAVATAPVTLTSIGFDGWFADTALVTAGEDAPASCA